MTIIRVPLTDISRELWLERRRNYINASETAIVVGESTWGSPAALYAEKKGLRPPLADSEVLQRGRWAEAAVFEAMAECYPEWKILRAKVHVIDEEKRQACTPDGFAKAPGRNGIGIVQAKVVARNIFRQKWLDDPSDNIQHGSAIPPAAYTIQALHEMALNDVKWGVIAVIINGEWGWHFRLFDVDRNPALEDRIDYRIATFFREYLDRNIMPPWEPERDDALVRELYPRDLGTAIDLKTDNRAIVAVDELIETQAAIKRMREKETALKTELEAKLGQNTFGLLPHGQCLSWKHQHRKAYTVEATDFRLFKILKRTPEEAHEASGDA
jgi:predicted phage-related endonuclease